MPKYRVIFKKTSLMPKSNVFWQSAKNIERYIAGYQDEVGKAEANKKAGREPAIEKPGSRKKASPGEEGKKEDQWKNLQHNKGSLWAGGFFGGRRSPGKNQPANQKAWINRFSREWTTLALPKTKRKCNGHRLAFSFSKDTVVELTRCGISPDIAAQEILIEGMKLYAKKHGWNPKDLGWLAGMHTDTDNFHMHVLLFPTTKQGVPLRVSSGRGGDYEDDLVEFTAFMDIAAEDYYRRYLPFDMQTPEVKLAWLQNKEAPMPKVEDYEVTNPVPQFKYKTPEHIESIRRRKREIKQREENAKKQLDYELRNNPDKVKELSAPTLAAALAPNLLQKITDHWILSNIQSLGKKALAGEQDISPNNPDPEKATKALELLEAHFDYGSSRLRLIEHELQAAHRNIVAIQKKEPDPIKENETPWEKLQRTWRQLLSKWNNTKLGQTRWQIEKLQSALQSPALRFRILVALQSAHIYQNEVPGMQGTIQGINDLRRHCDAAATQYQQTMEAAAARNPTEEGLGKTLSERYEAFKVSNPLAKQEQRVIKSIKNILNKTLPSPDAVNLGNLLSLGGQILLRFASIQKESIRSAIRLRTIKGKKIPVPAFAKGTPVKPEPETGKRSKPKFQPLRPPEFLNHIKMQRVFDARTADIEEKKIRESTPNLVAPESTPEEKKAVSPWIQIADRGLLDSILLELNRRKGKDKER